MPLDPPVILAIAVAALFVASSVAQRSGAHAALKAGVKRLDNADRRGPVGAVIDVIDRSVAAYTLRSRLGLSTLTREERHLANQHAAVVARAEEIRLARGGPVAHLAPTRLVVAGAASRSHDSTFAQPRSTLSVELLAAVLGFAVVVGVVIGIWPRQHGAVLSATGTPAISSPMPSTSAPSLPVPSAQ
ncbi:MAG TPA: hypothetical protein VFN41_05685 [Candidatus Limnocylindrales bacterium]|nr:hypothetical protein [Candidatus Limnocylindrales bacterium]